MSCSSDSGYLPISHQEKSLIHVKSGDRQSRTQSRARRLLAIIVLACVAIASVCFWNISTLGRLKDLTFVTTFRTHDGNTEADRSFVKHTKRAVGDRYLLGVGKADITGYGMS